MTLGDGLLVMDAFIMEDITGVQRVALEVSGEGLNGPEQILEEFLATELNSLKEFCKNTIDLIEGVQKHNAATD